MSGGRSRLAATALVCVAIWVFGLAWMWIDYHLFPQSVWKIELFPILVLLAMAVAAPVFLVACAILLVRTARAKS